MSQSLACRTCQRRRRSSATCSGGTFTEYGVHDEEAGPPLVTLKTDDLEGALGKVSEAGSEITQGIFEFPGGRRFHFTASGGVKLAAWTED
ncbi:VOC family protein [Tropicimonas sp. IMCC34011]|uniref:VOC family protein n=1 Tax=Tropicimonas sp. IMCC34011 TaxID=2248759 RepID=UPI001E5111E2|nr:hypothetical protein [Tropicimonas sp. IMCC34011]